MNNDAQNWSNIISDSGTSNVTSNESPVTNNPVAPDNEKAKMQYKQNLPQGILNEKPNAQQVK